jgi:hypothetical protein
VDSHEFQGWADINNNTKKEFVVDKTEIIGGDVSVQRHHHHHYAMADGAPRVSMMKARAAPMIQSQGEVAGLYTYSISDPYTLVPNSTFSLPFVKPVLSLERIAKANTYFNANNDKGKFERVYRIKSNQFLPAGNVTVREDNRVVGQTNIPDLTADESNDLAVGNDADVSYTRTTKRVSSSETSCKYEVVLTVRNNKKRAVKFEFNEQYGEKHDVVSSNQLVLFQNDSLKINASLNAEEEKNFAYHVTQTITPQQCY